jgi:hypothetical protein
VRSGNLARRLSTGVQLLRVLTPCCAGEDDDVTPSSRRLFRQSIRRPKWEEVDDDEWLSDVGHYESSREIPA